MLHPVHHLLTDPAHGLRLEFSGRKRWRPTLVVPRELCIFESMPCAGLAWHERSLFARTQAARRAPFTNFGCNAAVVSDRLMLWFWDEAEVSAAIHRAGLVPETLGRVVETLLLKLPGKEGEWELACAGGMDQLSLSRGAIVRSRWLKSSSEPAANRTAQPTPLLSRPWARELIGSSTPSRGLLSRISWFTDRQVLVPLGSATLVSACAAYTAYAGGMYWGTQRSLTELEAQADEADRKIGALATLRQTATSDSSWIASYTRLASGIQFDRLLASLTKLLEQYGVVIRELEIRQNEVRIAVSSAGGDIDLPKLLEGLATLEGVREVQLRDNVELTQASFSFRVPGYMALMAPSPSRP